MRCSRRAARVFALTLACLWATMNVAQTTGKPQQRAPYIFKANVGEVLVHATVVTKNGAPVINLPQSDFTIFENGVPQHIQFFSHEDAPVSVGILIDNSGSMVESRPAVNRAAINFIKASNPQDEEFVVNFNDEYYLDAAFTNNIPKLEDALQHIESRGGTAIYDATIASLDYMSNNAHNDKHLLLIITDGDDDASRYTLEQTVHLLQAKNSPLIYCIGILDHDDTHSMKNSAKRALIALAAATGGAAYFPKNLKQVNATTLAVAKEIRSQYTFAYHSNQTGAGFRAIRIEVQDKHQKHLNVRARKGYYTTGAAGPQ